jgi:hypothetical protein|nr:MAG TPA: hypothetical protein [Bacteriophage sp.]
MQFLDTKAGINFKLPNDIFDSNRLDNVRKFLRNRTSKQLLSLVYTYNQNNVDKIELEADKDFRDRKEFCDLNEIVDFYAKLYNDPTRLKIYIYE